MIIQPLGAFSAPLHPRGQGGKFAAKGSGGSSGSTTAPKTSAGTRAAKTSKRPAPNGLGYSTKQWAQLQQLEATAKAGGKLDAHQAHELHQAHEKRLAAMGKTPKAKASTTPKAKAAVKPKNTKAKTTKAKTVKVVKATPKTRRTAVTIRF